MASRDISRVQLSEEETSDLETLDYCDSADLGNPIDEFLKGDGENDVESSKIGKDGNMHCILRANKRRMPDATFLEQDKAEKEEKEEEATSKKEK